MFYSKSTAAIVAILDFLFLAILFVFAPKPYSCNVWFEAFMLIVGGVTLGVVCVKMCCEQNSPMPIAFVEVKTAFIWLTFIALMAAPLLFSNYEIKFRYYVLIHLIGAGVMSMIIIATRMSIRSIKTQDEEFSVTLNVQRRCVVMLSRLQDQMKQVDFGDIVLLDNLNRLNKKFRYGLRKGIRMSVDGEHIFELLDEMQEAFKLRNENELKRLADKLNLEFNDYERMVRF